MSRTFDSRIENLTGHIKEKNLNGILITNISNVRYLSGFTGSSGAVLLNRDQKGVFFTDFRYLEQAKKEVRALDVVKWEQIAIDYIAEYTEKLGINVLGVEAKNVSLDYYRRLKRKTKAKLRAAKDVVEGLRAVKDDAEIGLIREAVAITERSMEFAKNMLGEKLSEKRLALMIENHMRENGAEAVAFEPIVAAGANSSKPHAVPGDYVPKDGDFVIVDIGARYRGYCADMTRTFVVGKASDRQKKTYEAVRRASKSILTGRLINKKASSVHESARKMLESEVDGVFGHSLGHGVGIEVHEAPTLSPLSKDKLRDGMVFTVEPGLYLEGSFGIRIEDMVYLENGLTKVLTTFPRYLIEI